VLHHQEIDGARLVHGVIAHAPFFVPIAHAWVELLGDVVFDGVVQAFFTRASYYAIMGVQPQKSYSGAETRQLMDSSGYSGPWDESSWGKVGKNR